MRHALPFRFALAATLLVPVTALSQTDCEPQQLLPDPSGISFGRALAMTETQLIVGDWHDSRYCVVDPSCSNGMVYVYEKNADGRWALTQLVEPADLGPRFAFGAAVAVDGRWMVATAAGEFAGGGENGAVYFFEFDGERWVERQTFANPRRSSSFGIAAVVRDDVALVQSGAKAAFYRMSGDAWAFVGIVESPDAPRTSAGFGSSMAIDDDRVVIGAEAETALASNGGAAYVFRREPDGTLTFEQKLVAPDVLEGPLFGSSVAIEGDTLIVGGMLSDRPETHQGAAYAYRLIEGRWELVQEFTAEGSGERDRFGCDMSLDGDRLVVGSIQGYTSGLPTGSAYVFGRDDDGRWSQIAELPPSTSDPVHQYGEAVVLRGDDVVVGASWTVIDGEKRGAAHAFDLGCLLCRPDLDLDGALTVFDFLLFLNLFQDADPLADFDDDGQFTIFDFLAFQMAFDSGC